MSFRVAVTFIKIQKFMIHTYTISAVKWAEELVVPGVFCLDTRAIPLRAGLARSPRSGAGSLRVGASGPMRALSRQPPGQRRQPPKAGAGSPWAGGDSPRAVGGSPPVSLSEGIAACSVGMRHQYFPDQHARGGAATGPAVVRTRAGG